MKKLIGIFLTIIGVLNMASVALAEPVIEKPVFIDPDKFELRDDLTLINPDEEVDPDVEQESEVFFHYGNSSAKEIELLKDPYIFEPYMNLLPDSVKILLLQRMEQDDELSPADLKEIPIEIREQALEQTIRELREEELDRRDEPETADPIVEPVTTNSKSWLSLSKIKSFFSEYMVEFLALVVSVVGLILGVTGFSMAASKKKKSMSQFMNEIDDTFASFKWKSKRCEAELYRLHDMVDEKLKKGKIDESSYQLLVNRIDKYLTEIKELDIQGPPME